MSVQAAERYRHKFDRPRRRRSGSTSIARTVPILRRRHIPHANALPFAPLTRVPSGVQKSFLGSDLLRVLGSNALRPIPHREQKTCGGRRAFALGPFFVHRPGNSLADSRETSETFHALR